MLAEQRSQGLALPPSLFALFAYVWCCMPCPLCFNTCLCCVCLCLRCAMVLCAPMPWVVVLCLMLLLYAVYAVLICMQYNKPMLCPAIWGYSFKNRAYYRLIIWGYAFLFRVHATILAHLIVQKSPKFKKLAKPCKCWACGLYGLCFYVRFSPRCAKRRGIKYPRKIRLVKMGRKYGGIIWGCHRGLYFKPLFYTPSKSGVLSYRSVAYQALYPGRKKASFGLSVSPSQWPPSSCNQ